MVLRETERREFFRVSDHLLIEFRQVSREESQLLEQNLQHADAIPTTSCRLCSESGRGLKLLKGELYAYLEMLDNKLNAIIDLLSVKDKVYHRRYVDANISGAGIKYSSDVRLDEGIHLELRMVLPFFPNPRVTAIAEVVRSSDRSDGDEGRWETALSFVTLSEKDRDVLIGYIFAKERETLRSKHKL